MKTQYIMSYMEFRVQLGVLDMIEVAFLPVGYTHFEIEKASSCTSRRLNTYVAIKIPYFHEILSL